jgi:predicted NUDIX family NTP pyrophosphohydrolase
VSESAEGSSAAYLGSGELRGNPVVFCMHSVQNEMDLAAKAGPSSSFDLNWPSGRQENSSVITIPTPIDGKSSLVMTLFNGPSRA